MKNLLIIAIVLLSSVIAVGQGTVSGKVYDQETSEGLIAAFVEVVGTDIIESTDFDGKYVIDLPEGVYSIRVTYIGFQDKTIKELTITDGQTEFLDISMGTDAELLAEVVVTARAVKNTENYVLLERKKSDKIQDGIGRQELSRMGVSNVANAMTKVTGTSVTDGKYVYVRGLGDRYSITQLNGLNLPSIDPYRNSAQLDLIPANLVENLIVSKTFTPDLPGTFTGGLLDIKTRDYPERETLSISFSANYNTQTSGNGDFLTYTDEGSTMDGLGYGTKNRQVPDILQDPSVQSDLSLNAPLLLQFGRLGAEETDALASRLDAAANSLDYNFQEERQAAPLDHGVSVSYGNSYSLGGEAKLGLILAGGYKRSFLHIGTQDLTLRNADGALLQRWQLQNENADELLNRGDYVNQESTENPVVNGLVGLALKLNDFNSIDFKMLYNHNAEKSVGLLYGQDGRDIEGDKFKRSRALLFEEREMKNYQLSGRHLISALSDLEVTWNASMIRSSMDEPRLRFFNSQINTDNGVEGIPLSNLNRPFYFWRSLEDQAYSGKLDLSLPITFLGRSGSSIKAGGSYYMKDRVFNEDRYRVESPLTTGIRYGGSLEEFFSTENIGIVGQEEFPRYTNYDLGIFPLYSSVLANSYTGSESVSAAYLMSTLAITDKLKFVGGARLETTSIFVESRDSLAADSLRIGSIDNSNLLPSANLIYAVNDQMNIRASFSQTIARPSLREIAPYSSFDPSLNNFYDGNPDLVTTDITNIDLRWEYFFAPGELIAVSSFYKDFKNPITVQYQPSSNIEFRFVNVEQGEIMGIEIELRKGLGFISPRLEKFKINTNVAFINSSMSAPEDRGTQVPTERPFEGQSDVLINGGLSYVDVDAKFNASINVNYFGDRLEQIGREGTPDIYERSRTSLDFVMSKRFGRIGFGLSAKNLLNPIYQSSSTYKGQEFIYSRFRRGRDFSLSVSYTM